MTKIDYRKEFRNWYRPTAREVGEVDLPVLNYLMIDGAGDPNTAPEYAAAIEALCTVAYTLKFMVKKGECPIDFGVMPLEGLWWADDMAVFSAGTKHAWKWTMMIMQPEVISAALVREALAGVKRKKNPAALERIRFESLAEGRCAQLMHLGPFTEEGPTVEKVHRFIAARNGVRSGKHHEIYLSDVRKAAPAKWKTVVRQPFA